jgi:O-antigen ligase
LVRLARACAYVAMVFLPLLKFRVGKVFDLSDAIFLIGALFLVLSRRPAQRAPAAPAWYVGAFVFILAGVVASSQAVSTSASLEVVINAIFVFLLLAWMLRQLLDTTRRIQIAMICFVLGSTASAFVAFLQTEFHALGYSHAASLEGSRAVGLSNQPNIAAVAFALALVFALGLLVDLGLRRNWYLAFCVCILAGALIFSASVSGIASTLVGCFVLFIRRGFKVRTWLGIIAALAVVYLAAVSIQSSGTGFNLNPIARIEQTTGTNTGYNTVNPRVATLERSWSGIVLSPIVGHGLDALTIDVYYDPDVGVAYPAHNIVVLYWFAGGIFMLAGGAIMMGSGFNRLLSGRWAGRRDNTMRDTVLAGCVTVLFFSLQSPEIVDRWLWLPFMLALCFRGQKPVDAVNGSTSSHAALPLTPATSSSSSPSPASSESAGVRVGGLSEG